MRRWHVAFMVAAIALLPLVGCTGARTGPPGAAPSAGGVAALPDGAQRLAIGGLVVTVGSTAAPLPDAGPAVPADAGSGKRWLSVTATLTNPTDAPVVVGAGAASPYLTDASGTTIDSAFEGMNVPRSSNLSSLLPGSPAQGGPGPSASEAPALSPGDSIGATGQWAVPASGHGFRFVWDLGPAGVARFTIP